MLQLILISLLGAEAIFYVWLYLSLIGRGVSGSAIAALVLLLALLWRLSHALASFVVTTALRVRDGRTLPWGNSLTALANEFAARFVCFNWAQAFPGLAIGPDPRGRRDGVPILLVHGYVCNRGLWVAMSKKLAAAGLGPIYTISLTPLFGGMDTLVSALTARVEAICAQTGAAKVMLVAHSMGGLVARAYLAQTESSRVAKLVTLGSPHHGTELTRLGLGINASQMSADSVWLKALASREAGRVQPTTLSIYTLNDDLVYPPESSALAWAQNVPVSATGHMGLVFSDAVADRVIRYLR